MGDFPPLVHKVLHLNQLAGEKQKVLHKIVLRQHTQEIVEWYCKIQEVKI